MANVQNLSCKVKGSYLIWICNSDFRYEDFISWNCIYIIIIQFFSERLLRTQPFTYIHTCSIQKEMSLPFRKVKRLYNLYHHSQKVNR